MNRPYMVRKGDPISRSHLTSTTPLEDLVSCRYFDLILVLCLIIWRNAIELTNFLVNLTWDTNFLLLYFIKLKFKYKVLLKSLFF